MGKQQSPQTPDTARKSEESGAHTFPGWFARQKRRWKSLLDWLAKGAEHACPT